MNTTKSLPIEIPNAPRPEVFTDAAKAVARLCEIYDQSVTFLCGHFSAAITKGDPQARYRAFYPEIRFTTTTYTKADTRLSFGHVAEPGTYKTTVTRPDLFASYLEQQINLLMKNHGEPVTIGPSDTVMPVHFAVANVSNVTVPQDGAMHYTATAAEHFQNHILFTNYQFYVEEFEAYAREMLADPNSGYASFVSGGNIEITDADAPITPLAKMPQMPTYHLKRANGGGITLVNIGVGPSNAKTATDHIAVLRPHAWLMVGHCAGLRNSQSLGDFVLAHAYLREDHVLDDDLPVWVPIPALAEIQIALESAVADVTKLEGYELKRIMRTGTVATIDNRNWELRDHSGPVQRLSQSRAVGLDMESATIAANGFRFRVPYGTLLCVSDKPLHGELKLPGMASDFYKTQVARHLMIGIRAMETLREMPLERIHSRKLRSFEETAFL